MVNISEDVRGKIVSLAEYIEVLKAYSKTDEHSDYFTKKLNKPENARAFYLRKRAIERGGVEGYKQLERPRQAWNVAELVAYRNIKLATIASSLNGFFGKKIFTEKSLEEFLKKENMLT